jgi:hypothetical protein
MFGRRGAEARSAVGVTQGIPPEARATDIEVRDDKVHGPGGMVFGTLLRLGPYNRGATTIQDFFRDDPAAFPDISPSLQRVIQAVSQNEGRLEAINTYDRAFLSAGILQWTAGVGNEPGELAGLLDTLQRDPAVLEEYFGRYGLGYELESRDPGALIYGHLTLDGRRLDETTKETLRAHLWAYRFWRAAHVPAVRRAQVRLAMSRVGTFCEKPVAGARRLSDYITSEYGVALLLDQHVNRPVDVPETLMQGVADHVGKTGRNDPAGWTSADERAEAGQLQAVSRASCSPNDTLVIDCLRAARDAA